jgi:hypothetical protein
MGQKEESSSEWGDDQKETVEPALADSWERPSEAAVNSAVALTLLGGEGEGDEPAGHERHEESRQAQS